jgi:hypothetical protein
MDRMRTQDRASQVTGRDRDEAAVGELYAEEDSLWTPCWY